MFTGHKYIEDYSEETGFNQYLLIDSDNGHNVEAYGFDEDTLMDIDKMLDEVYGADFSVLTYPQSGGPNYAAIITDSRTPDSVAVWTSCDFYLEA